MKVIKFKKTNFWLSLLTACWGNGAIAEEQLVGMWAKCSLPCLDDNLGCWTEKRVELEWFTQSGKSIYILGPKLRNTPDLSIPDQFPANLEGLATSLKKIDSFEIYASITDYLVEGSRITYSDEGDEGDDEPWTVFISGVSQNRYSYSFKESDGEVVTVEMCRSDEFSPLLGGLARYLDSRNALDSSFDTVRLVGSSFFDIPQSIKDGKPEPLFPLTLVSDDTSFAVLMDLATASGSMERINLAGNIRPISPAVTVIFNVLNEPTIAAALKSAF